MVAEGYHNLENKRGMQEKWAMHQCTGLHFRRLLIPSCIMFLNCFEACGQNQKPPDNLDHSPHLPPQGPLCLSITEIYENSHIYAPQNDHWNLQSLHCQTHSNAAIGKWYATLSLQVIIQFITTDSDMSVWTYIYIIERKAYRSSLDSLHTDDGNDEVSVWRLG